MASAQGSVHPNPNRTVAHCQPQPRPHRRDEIPLSSAAFGIKLMVAKQELAESEEGALTNLKDAIFKAPVHRFDSPSCRMWA